MTSDEVYKLIEANSLTLHGDIEHFAALVASAEREACAKVCDYLWEDDYSAYACAEAIRARGQA
jgi:hypothetical protein